MQFLHDCRSGFQSTEVVSLWTVCILVSFLENCSNLGSKLGSCSLIGLLFNPFSLSILGGSPLV